MDKREDTLMKDFFGQKCWAVVGVTANREKFGYRVYKALLAKLKVYPVNAKYAEIDGVKCYASLSQLPELPDVVDIITPPKVTLEIVKECSALGIKKVWMQPGAESEEALEYCRQHGIEAVALQCAKVEINRYL